MKKKYRTTFFLIAFVDILLAFVAYYTACNAIELIAMNPPQEIQKGNVVSDAQIMIEITWEKDCDFDLWVKDPKGNLVYFKQADMGAGHLERDSMGSMNNYIPTGDGANHPTRFKENWFMREIIPGTYRANIHLYSCYVDPNKHRSNPGTPEQASVTMSAIKLNPRYELITERNFDFKESWQEVQGIKFDIDSNGYISNIETNDELWVNDTIKPNMSAN